ncbi:MAG TPA: DUF4157 domain-containing protein [Pyrinomonadaceae bacterium]|nr:DUF4157 domain-containing protein [Pyrinomonadaceae bacterium]
MSPSRDDARPGAETKRGARAYSSPPVYLSNRPALSLGRGPETHAARKVQFKLAVSRAGDVAEQEADRAAERVVSAPEAEGVGPTAQGSGARETLRRSSEAGVSLGAGDAPESVRGVLSSAGRQLDDGARAFMEPRFGMSFGHVRVHADDRAADSARDVGALAYTVGRDIVFGAGQFAPDTQSGRRLLAHELAHVAQQEPSPTLRRQPINSTPVNVSAVAAEVQKLVRPDKKEKEALEKLNGLDMRDLLNVVEKLYNDIGDQNDEGKRRAFGILNGLLATVPNDETKNVNVSRLRTAFDAAPSRHLRNPTSDTDLGTTPTHSASRREGQGKAKHVAQIGDWGEDPLGNTWVRHSDGIRTYFGTTTPKKERSSAWLGNNPGNADYVKSLTKRAISSFRWGKGAHHFAIYFTAEDGAADLRDRIKTFQTVGNHVRAHLGNNPKENNNFELYIEHIQSAAPGVSEGTPTSEWTTDDAKWRQLLAGYKKAEGWKEGKTLTAANVGTVSSDPKDAPAVEYYKTLLGAP